MAWAVMLAAAAIAGSAGSVPAQTRDQDPRYYDESPPPRYPQQRPPARPRSESEPAPKRAPMYPTQRQVPPAYRNGPAPSARPDTRYGDPRAEERSRDARPDSRSGDARSDDRYRAAQEDRYPDARPAPRYPDPRYRDARPGPETREARPMPGTREARPTPGTREARPMPGTRDVRPLPGTRDALQPRTAQRYDRYSESADRQPTGRYSAGMHRCGNPVGVEVFTSPDRPVPGEPLRVVAVSERDIEGELFVISPDGERLAQNGERRGGPPYWWMAEVIPRTPGPYRGVISTGGSTACADTEVSYDSSPLPERPSSAVWPVERRWNRDMENLFSAWVEKLFDDPLDASPSWKSLHEITREPSRNFLHNHLGFGEDSEGGLELEPDCADLPYFLRGYFAWKMRLPFGYSKCHRVAAGQPPTCSEWFNNLKAASPGSEVSRVQKFLARDVGWGVHSGTDRTLGEDDRTDVYPTRLSAETLRPGTVFADPYGHILVLVRRIPQTPRASGQFLAVDAQPDGTVARKQFWRGTFLFTVDPKLGGAGFKNFRPILGDADGLRLPTNEEVLDHPDYGDFSLEQYRGGTEGFYDKMDEVLSPQPRRADQVMREIVDSLEQQVKARVDSVANGEEYMRKNPSVVPLPKGAAIFQTVGPWEDYATPSRDLRLLIAIDVVRGFPERVARRPERYILPRDGGDVRRELQALLEEETRRRTFEYERSDGSSWTLRLSDVLERAALLEMAYNPNDCVEVRWGAPEGSDERATCKRHAPQDQHRKMNHQYRDWFSERRRPST